MVGLPVCRHRHFGAKCNSRLMLDVAQLNRMPLCTVEHSPGRVIMAIDNGLPRYLADRQFGACVSCVKTCKPIAGPP